MKPTVSDTPREPESGYLRRSGRRLLPMTRPRHDPNDDGSGIVRRLLRWERDFTQLANSWLRDERLSYVARGILAMLMTHEHGYRVTLKAIAAATPKSGSGEGLRGVRAAVEELETIGYLVRIPVSKGGRFVADRWEICDPSGLYDPALFGLAGVVDKSRVRRVPSEHAEPYRVPSEHAYRVPSEHPLRTQVKNIRGARSGARSAANPPADDLWKTSITTTPCTSRDGHSWPSARAVPAFTSPEGMVPCLHSCGVEVSGTLLTVRQAATR